MNIYFTASIVGKKQYLPNYLKIIDILKQENHHVTHEHIINSTEAQIDLQTKENREQFHKKLRKWIMESDCMIVEASFPSISVGFEISLALNFGKPVLILYTTEIPTLFKSYNDEKLICEEYKLSELKEIINDFLNFAEGKNEYRFTFFIDSKIANFLEETSRKKRVPKSVFLRQLIDKARNSNDT